MAAAYERTPARIERHSLYDWAWTQYSRKRLIEHSYCVRCDRLGRTRAAVVTDHIVPHRGNEKLFRDPLNHQSLCKGCHDRKTRLEDGGGGRSAPIVIRAPDALSGQTQPVGARKAHRHKAAARRARAGRNGDEM